MITNTYEAGKLRSSSWDTAMKTIYGEACDCARQSLRWAQVMNRHRELFGNPPYGREIALFSIPGRTELGGNHTDHNHGMVLAGAVNLDTLAAAVPTDDMTAVIVSEGFPEVRVDLSSLPSTPQPALFGSTASLVQGIASALREAGYRIGGFRAAAVSDVRKGSGLSSSASIEITIGSLFNDFWNHGTIDMVTLAKIGQMAENRWFGKPSGLMDQLACACGGIIAINFSNPTDPVIDTISSDFSDSGFALAVVDTGGNHADLTDCYASIPVEMGSIARYFGSSVLRGVTMEQLLGSIPELRKKFGDRAILRSLHFFQENKRAVRMADALRSQDYPSYLAEVQESGSSSFKYLQNLYPPAAPEEQGLSVALALTEMFLEGSGACRVHGGGFAGTVQAYIPSGRKNAYRKMMEQVFGPDSVEFLTIRSMAAGRIA